MKTYVLFLYFPLLLFLPGPGMAQLISIDPPDATTDAYVTITYDARLGNAHLEGYDNAVYAYTGVITTNSRDDADWKHVLNNWGVVNPNTRMTPLGDDLYELSFHVRDFYGIGEDETVLKLAFLFHNEDYSLVGRTARGGDIFVGINQRTPGAYVSHELIGEKLEVRAENGLIKITFYTPAMVKAEFVPDGTDLVDTTFTVIARPEPLEPELSLTPQALVFSSAGMQVVIGKDPLRLHYLSGGDTLLSDAEGFFASPRGGGTSLAADGSASFYGGGSRAIPIDRSGRRLRIFNEAHFGYGDNTPNLNISIPYVVSGSGTGLFFDNRYPAELDLGTVQPGRLEYSTDGGRLRYFVIAGNDFDHVMQEYTWLTGRQKLPPVWSLGYIQSKYGYRNETEAREIVGRIRGAGFPLDALILDLYWFGEEGDMGNLDWDLDQWPQPESMMSDFNDMGIRTILITEPYFTLESDHYPYLADNGYFGKDPEGDPYVLWGFWAGNASLIDLTQRRAREWMWSFYKARREEGVGGWWSDLGEPEAHPQDMVHEFGDAPSVHNIYSLIWARFLDRNYETHYPGERLFNLIRSGYAGMQRYSTFPWSGDIQRSFDGLRAQIPVMLGAGMTGLGYMHSDVGGFIGADDDGELFTRWVQFGVFAPVLRMHGIGRTEPVNFPEPYKSIMRESINLRYRLLPYNYTLAYENSTAGTPLARQLNYYQMDDPMLSDINDAYFWGKDLLVAPVLHRGAAGRSVAFPQGKWLHYHDLTEYEGGQTYTVPVQLEHIPVFVRAGSFIPTAGELASTAYYVSDSLKIQYFPDSEVTLSYGYMFDDDKNSTTSLDAGAYELLHFEGIYEDSHMDIMLSLSGQGYAGAPDIRNMLFEVFRVNLPPSGVTIDGKEIPGVDARADFRYETPAYFFDQDRKVLYVNCAWDGKQKHIRIDEATVSSVGVDPGRNDGFFLHLPWPNPFSHQFTVQADIEYPGTYYFILHNASGGRVGRKVRRIDTPGRISFEWNTGPSLPAGMYVLTMQGKAGRQVHRLIRQ